MVHYEPDDLHTSLGRVLVIEGLEKAKRNILSIINNLLENREMQLEDRRLLINDDKYQKLLKTHR